ncbi:hypothetical protein Tco_1319099 [Tanacetum coccineum]
MSYLGNGIEDAMLIASKSKAEIGSTKSLLKKEFDMKELGEAKKILVWRSIDHGKSVHMSLGRHVKLSLCPVRDCDVERMSKVSYANVIGSLMYLMVCTRPDIAYAVSVVSRYLANLGKNHWEAVKWILKYLWGTSNVGLMYGTYHGNHVDVTGFVDSDYTKDPDKEVEYMALTKAVNEAIWLRGLWEELGMDLNTVRTKHINVRYYFIREVLEAKTVKVLKVGTEHNAANALTKVVEGDFEVEEVKYLEYERAIYQSHNEVYGCLKGGSRNSGGKRLAISMVEEAWLSEKEEV